MNIGAAEIDVTPDFPVDLSGFGLRTQPSLGVLEPIFARALFLDDDDGGDEKLLWIACGTDDRLVQNARQLSDLLDQHQIRHEFHATPGNHSWPVWRRYLAEFAPLLFTNQPRSTAALRSAR